MSVMDIAGPAAGFIGTAVGCALSAAGSLVAPPAIAAAILSCGGVPIAQASLINSLGCLSAAAGRENPEACTLINRMLAENGQPTLDEIPEDRRNALAEGARLARQQLISSWREAAAAHRPWVEIANRQRNTWRIAAVVTGVAAVGLVGGAAYMAATREVAK